MSVRIGGSFDDSAFEDGFDIGVLSSQSGGAYVALEGDFSIGEPPFPPTVAIGPFSTKTQINGKYIQLQGITHYADHTDGIIVHPSSMRIVTSGSSTLQIEGYYVARVGDFLGDGDMIAGPGSIDTFIG